MIAESNYDKCFPFKSTFDLQIQDGGLWSLPKYRQVEELVIFCIYLDENLYWWVWGSVSPVLTLKFHLGVHLTLKSNMAAFDLCRGTAKISNNFAQYSSMCMYSADFSYTEVLMIAESNYDTFFI